MLRDATRDPPVIRGLERATLSLTLPPLSLSAYYELRVSSLFVAPGSVALGPNKKKQSCGIQGRDEDGIT